jgi:hypothetical protein
MAKDKARDDKFFNCSKQHEVDYVAGLYEDSAGVRDLLAKKCADGTIHYSTNLEVYKIIKDELGYDIKVGH